MLVGRLVLCPVIQFLPSYLLCPEKGYTQFVTWAKPRPTRNTNGVAIPKHFYNEKQ